MLLKVGGLGGFIGRINSLFKKTGVENDEPCDSHVENRLREQRRFLEIQKVEEKVLVEILNTLCEEEICKQIIDRLVRNKLYRPLHDVRMFHPNKTIRHYAASTLDENVGEIEDQYVLELVARYGLSLDSRLVAVERISNTARQLQKIDFGRASRWRSSLRSILDKRGGPEEYSNEQVKKSASEAYDRLREEFITGKYPEWAW